jgi:hypothetical protein
MSRFSSSQTLSALSLTLIFSLIGCSLPKPQDRGDDSPDTSQSTATFFVDKSEASVTSQESDAQFSLPIAKNYSFKACVKEAQYSRPIVNHTFEILGGPETTTTTSDSNGCVIWSEKISYNHLAPAQWVETVRSIRAKGIQKGQRQISLALNPWENQAESLANKKMEKLQTGDAAVAALNPDIKQGVWIDDLRLTVNEKKVSDQGVTLNFEIRAQPSTPLLKASGDRVWEPLTKGHFEAEIILISVLNENQKEVRRAITAPIKIKDAKIQNNALLIETPIVLSPASRYGQIELGLKITPLDGPQNLSSFQGVFNIAEYDNIKGSFFSRLKNEFQKESRDLTIDQYVTDKTTAVKSLWSNDPNLAQDHSHTNAFQQAQVRIQQPLTYTAVGYKGGQAGLNREKIFTITACMVAPIDSKPFRAQSFQVQKINGQKETLNSNDQGCITWEDSIQFQYLDRECWQPKQVTISNTTLGMNQSLNVQVNPWAEGPSSFRDTRNIGKQQLLCAEGKSEITVVTYSFKKERIHYPIDSKLNIKVQKQGTLALQARLVRPSLVEATNFETPYALPPGRYILRWAIVEQEIQDFSKAAGAILQVQEKTIEIKPDGVINGILSFESSNLRALANANSLLVEILPEGKNEHFNITTFKAAILMSEGTDSGQFTQVPHAPNESLILKLREQMLKDIEARKTLDQKLAQKETFATRENLQLLNLNNEASTLKFRQAVMNPLASHPGENPYLRVNKPPLAPQALNQWVHTGKIPLDLERTLCNYWFFDQIRRPLIQANGNQHAALPTIPDQLARLQQNCLITAQSPNRSFDIQYRYFLKDAAQALKADGTEDMTTEIKDLSFGYSFSLSQSHDAGVGTSVSADASVTVKLPTIIELLSPVSIGVGTRVAIAKSEADRHSRSNSTNISSTQSLALEKLSFKIRSSGYEKCAVIRMRSNLAEEALAILKPRAQNPAQAAALTQAANLGYMLCEGVVQNRNIIFTEEYYVLNQRLMSQVVDNTSNQGRPLFMVIRGANDFRRLINNLNGHMTAPNSPDRTAQTERAGSTEIAPIFNIGFPTYPGAYVAGE